jgi:hypothetical protein
MFVYNIQKVVRFVKTFFKKIKIIPFPKLDCSRKNGITKKNIVDWLLENEKIFQNP